jgi:hypothetical protein
MWRERRTCCPTCLKYRSTTSSRSTTTIMCTTYVVSLLRRAVSSPPAWFSHTVWVRSRTNNFFTFFFLFYFHFFFFLNKDIYFTRVFPSKTFDLLREDFDYFFVSTLMVGLVLGTVLSKKLASSSNLKKAWK